MLHTTTRRTRCAAVTVASALALAACSGGGDSGGSAPTNTVKLTTTVPAAKGAVSTVKWNLPTGEPNTIDPSQSALENISTVVGNMCESLFRFSPTYELEPNLATSVETPDNKTYVFNLRSGVKFWDGKPMTAADVVYSMKRTADPKTASSWAAAFTRAESISQTGPLQVTVKLKTPDAAFRWYEATPSMAVVEKAFVEQKGKAFGTPSGGVSCTGPFKFSQWQQGRSITLTKNANYWDKSRRPFISNLQFGFNTDASSQTAALQRGDIDGQFGNAVASFKQLSSSDVGKLLFGPSLSPTFAQMFSNSPSLKNPKIRAALRLIVDYTNIAKSVYGGAAIPIKTLTPPATWGYAKGVYQAAWNALPAAKQDLGKAKTLVKQAGSQSSPIVLGYNSSNPEESKIALSMQSGAQQVGLKLTIKGLNASAYNSLFYTASARAALSGFVVTGYLDFPEPLEYALYATKGSYYNYTGYDNTTYNTLLAKASSTLDDGARAKLITEAEAVTAKDNYSIPIVSQNNSVFVNKRLTGLVPNGTYFYTSWAATLGAAS